MLEGKLNARRVNDQVVGKAVLVYSSKRYSGLKIAYCSVTVSRFLENGPIFII